VASNPQNPSQLVTGFADFQNDSIANDAAPGVARSTDGGKTWIAPDQGPILPNPPGFIWGNRSLATHLAAGDSAVAWGLGNTVYFSTIGFHDNSSPPNGNCASGGLYVYRSNDGGNTWNLPANGSAVANTQTLYQDGEYIAVDSNPTSPFTGRVYMVWDEDVYSGCPQNFPENLVTRNIRFSFSSDGGATWSAPTVLATGCLVKAVPAVAANGDLHVVWYDCNAGIRQLVRKSTNGGLSFSPPVAAASGLTAPPSPLFGSNFRVNAAFPVIATDPTDANRVYVAWSSNNGASQTDVFVSRSLNGGSTWSAPLRVNDDAPGNPRDQFFPWIAVDGDGTVRLMWGDDRLDSVNPGGKLYDIFMAESIDHGTSFGPNVRVTTQSSNPDFDGFRGTFIGDYFGLSASGVAVWGDTRNGNQDIFGGPPVGSDIAATFQWPLSPFTTVPNVTQDYTCRGITSGFDSCVKSDQYHTGIDVTPASSDQNIYASEEGTVVAAVNDCDPGVTSCNGGFGNTVIIQHATGLYSQYGHLQKGSITVGMNQGVIKGQKIGVIGNTGNVTGTHLHFEIKNHSNLGPGYTTTPPDVNGYFDPWKYISTTAVSPVPVRVINSTGLSVRRGPSTSYSVFTTVNFDQTFVAFAASGGWYRIYLPCNNSNSCAGWIAGTVSGTTFSVEDQSATQVEVKNTGTAGLFVRPSPASSSSLDKIWDGQRFVVLGTSSPAGSCTNNWYQIDLPAISGASNGWSCGDFLTVVPGSTPITRTLAVASSNPNTGVFITVSPNDNDGNGNDTTQFARTYNTNTPVTLTAPSTTGGKNFGNWSGCNSAVGPTCNVTMSTDKTVTAAYVTPPPITVLSPNGSEIWKIGTTHAIQWTTSGITGNVKVQISRNGGATWANISKSTANDGNQPWKVTKPATNQGRIRICSVKTPSICDTSNANFTIQ